MRGKDDAWNSGIAGSFLGLLAASRKPVPWAHPQNLLIGGLTAFTGHYFYDLWWAENYEEGIRQSRVAQQYGI